MFKKVLVANRGEIAARIVRACRDLDIPVVALYDTLELESLHVRLANECVALPPGQGYHDPHTILQIALDTGADAIHPGYGFLAEHPDFTRACESSGITFIGPPSAVLDVVHNRVTVLEQARAAGFATPDYSPVVFTGDNLDLLPTEAERIGYPLLIKPCGGGYGRGTKIVYTPDELDVAVQHARAESQTVFGSSEVYLEHALIAAHSIEVQVLGDQHGNLIHLGERENVFQWKNQRIIEESPAPSLSPSQRDEVRRLAVELARLFHCQNACTIEFLADADGHFYFTEIKPRIQIKHPVTEMVTGIDIVREQLRIAAGEPLRYTQADVRLQGCAMLCRITAEDPWNNFLPSPGRLRQFRLPGGPGVRVDTDLTSGSNVLVQYDPMLAKVIVWDVDRDGCLQRMRRTLEDFTVSGVMTDLPLLRSVLADPGFVQGTYTSPESRSEQDNQPADQHAEQDRRAIAIAAAIAYARRMLMVQPTTPERRLTGWHHDSRRLPS